MTDGGGASESVGRTTLRSQDELKDLPRWMWRNHKRRENELRREVRPAATAAEERSLKRKITDLVRGKWLKWIWTYVRARIARKHTFPDYSQGRDSGIYPLVADGSTARGGPVRVSLASDWATGTLEARDVARAIGAFAPHFTMHLGDTYYVGESDEVRNNYFDLVEWPLGSVGSFALNGNHEMYAKGGRPYFVELLPKFGMRNGQPSGQKASFFCLENEHWRLIGLDTGYNSTRIPFVEKLPFLKSPTSLPGALVTWLEQTVRLGADRTHGIVLLSHHQYYSAFDAKHTKAATQLKRLLARPALWLWGHEHRLAFYGRHAEDGGIEAYGRCIGHAAMPIEDVEDDPGAKAEETRLVLHDSRRTGSGLGVNGFVNLTFQGERLRLEYCDRDGQIVVTEEWWTDAVGRLQGEGITGGRGMKVFGRLSDAQA